MVNVESEWKALSENYSIPPDIACSVWSTLETKYSEAARHYHTLNHISSLLALSQAYSSNLRDKSAVDMSIFFHDVVYDPLSKSNEEDSAQLFISLLGEFINPIDIQKVAQYIIETKKHDVLESTDSDLQYFIDFDMSILGSDLESYLEYCRCIRKEYGHVPDAAFCTGRSTFLATVITENKRIFATDDFFKLFEDKARSNIQWECGQLKSGILA